MREIPRERKSGQERERDQGRDPDKFFKKINILYKESMFLKLIIYGKQRVFS